MKIIRTSSLSLKYATRYKTNQLQSIFDEYKKLVLLYIDIYWKQEKLPLFPTDKVETWLSVRLQRKAAKQAIQIIKSTRANERNYKYKRFKKVYAYFSKQNRQLKFLQKRFRELNLIYKIKPCFDGNMELDKDIVNFIDVSSTRFDRWIKINCVGNKIKLVIPCNIHKHFKKYKNWKQLSGCRIRQTNNHFYLDCLFEKDIQDKQGNSCVALDLGINTLISTSNNEQYGKDFKQLLQKLNKKQHGSKQSKRLRNLIKQYIDIQVKKLPMDYDKLILEDLKYIQIGTKQRVNKSTRKLLSRWNLGYLHKSIQNKCELNGIQVIFINPKYTSRTCPRCGYQNKKNRSGEKFCCKQCGYTQNADINAANNILQRFYQERQIVGTVPDFTKEILCNKII